MNKTNTRTLKLGTRGSKLALWQTNWIIARLKTHQPDLQIETRIFTTQGDKIQDRPLQNIGGEDGFFVRELEEALLRGEIDLAVHSLKDLPHQQPSGLIVPCIPGRADASDALISRDGASLADLPQGALLGTSSTRRTSQLLAFRSDYRLRPLRGNVDTRMRKLQESLGTGVPGEQYDGIILATAGLERLDRGAEITQRLPFDVMLPAPGQGALAPECRADDEELLGYLADLNQPEAQAAITAEKAFMAGLGGGCQTPVGCYAEIVEGQIMIRGFVGAPDGSQAIRLQLIEVWAGSLLQAQELGQRLAEQAQAQGAIEILAAARAAGYVTERK